MSTNMAMKHNSIKYIKDDIANTDAMWVAHQCNTTTTTSAGLAKHLFNRFPYANTYKNGFERIAGTVSWHGYDVPSQNTGVVNLYAQIGPRKAWRVGDKRENRIKWFKECLECMVAMNKYDFIEYGSFAFPDHIGCGFAGGDWENDYLPMIEDFANRIRGIVYIYSL